MIETRLPIEKIELDESEKDFKTIEQEIIRERAVGKYGDLWRDMLTSLKPTFREDEVRRRGEVIQELRNSCCRLLEEEIIPAIPGGEKALRDVFEQLKEDHALLNSEVGVSSYRKLPDDAPHKTGLFYYQLANRAELLEALHELKNMIGKDGVSDYEEFLKCDRKRQDEINALVEHNMRLVFARAWRKRNPLLEPLDMFQEGSIGLMLAIDRYDPARARLGTFATAWIDDFIQRAIDRKGRTLRLPYRIAERLSSLYTTVETLAQELGREPTILEIADRMGKEPEDVEQWARLARGIIPLDAPARGLEKGTRVLSDTETIMDHGAAKDIYTPDFSPASLLEEEHVQFMEEALGCLSPKQQAVIQMRLAEDMTLDEIGARIGISYERVRKIEQEAIADLRFHFITQLHLNRNDFFEN